MAKMSPEVQDLFKKVSDVVFTTASASGQPNSCVVGMKAANDFIAQAGKVDALQSTAVTALMLLVVYGGYFLATALACRRLALQGSGARR